MALTYSKPGELGSLAPSFDLPGVDGGHHRLKDYETDRQGVRVLVVVFMCNHCPYVIATQGRMNRLAKSLASRGVGWLGINSNDATRYPDDNFEAMKLRAQEQGFVFPYLYDESQEVARAFGAVCTPEFFVFGRDEASRLILRYQGRLDDYWKDEAGVKECDLADAIDEILAGKNPSRVQKPALGCSIKWKTQ